MEKRDQPVAAIVVAAGSGSRLGHDLPKALVELAGVALVRHAVAALSSGGVGRFVVVAPKSHLNTFRELFDSQHEVTVIPGGAERPESVACGLAAIDEGELVLVHDAARPLVPPMVVKNVLAALRSGARAVVPVLPMVDSVRAVSDTGNVALDRDSLRIVQTPQGFQLATLRRAHQHVAQQGLSLSDDASACEAIGETISLVAGHVEAMKITTPIDLIVASTIIRDRA